MNVEQQKLIQIFYGCDRHVERIASVVELMGKFMPLTGDAYEHLDENQGRCIDQFLFRFSKLQDTMGKKLFKLYLHLEKEYTDNQSFLDLLNRLEKMEILDKDTWVDFRNARNELAHEYGTNDAEVADAINKIYGSHSELLDIYSNLKNVSIKKGFYSE